MAGCLERIDTLICIDGNNTHSAFPPMLRRLEVEQCMEQRECQYGEHEDNIYDILILITWRF